MKDLIQWWKELKWWWKIPAVFAVLGGLAALAVVWFGETLTPPPKATSTKEIKKLLDDMAEDDVQLQEEAREIEQARAQQLEVDHEEQKSVCACGDSIGCVDAALAEARKKRRVGGADRPHGQR